jgi:hypothetical protein
MKHGTDKAHHFKQRMHNEENEKPRDEKKYEYAETVRHIIMTLTYW